MAERVGFISNVTPEWLDTAFSCAASGKSEANASAALDELISHVFTAKDNIGKSRRVLTTIFYGSDSWILQNALSTGKNMPNAERIPIYLSLLMASYPIFYDTCVSIGSALSYRETISLMQVRQRIYDKWGARSIIHQAVKKVFQTLKDFGILTPIDKQGNFTISQILVNDPRIVYLLTDAVLQSGEKEYMTWESIINHPALFAFRIEHVTQADIAACDHLLLERMGDEIVIRTK